MRCGRSTTRRRRRRCGGAVTGATSPAPTVRPASTGRRGQPRRGGPPVPAVPDEQAALREGEMKRRDFLRFGGWSGAGLALGPASLAALVAEAQAQSAATGAAVALRRDGRHAVEQQDRPGRIRAPARSASSRR
ncbi:MAG: hypothetical protein MZW92_73595 [Comamonadaceae bacterium]|nr:hypothetical protein [Comamonadaceae bacterium]